MAKRAIVVEAVILNRAGQVLLVRQGRDTPREGWWELPGGHVKKREAIDAALRREVQEETGALAKLSGLQAIYFIRGERTHDFVFVARLTNERRTTLRPAAPEIAACEFFSPHELPAAVKPFTANCVRDAVSGVVHPLPIALSRGKWLA